MLVSSLLVDEHLLLHGSLGWSSGGQSPVKLLWLDLLRSPRLATRSQFHIILNHSHLSKVWNRVGGTVRVAKLSISTTVCKTSWSCWKPILVPDCFSCWSSNNTTEANQRVQGVLHAMVNLPSSVHLLCNLSIEQPVPAKSSKACRQLITPHGMSKLKLYHCTFHQTKPAGNEWHVAIFMDTVTSG